MGATTRRLLKALGFINPGTRHALKPRTIANNSVTFTLHMWIPALIALCFSLAQLAAAYYLYKTNRPPSTWESDMEIWLWGASFPLLVSVYTLSRWRSVTVFRDGSAELNRPFIIVRRKTRFEPNTIWLDVIRKIPSKEQTKRYNFFASHPSIEKILFENPDFLEEMKSSNWEKMLVIHDRKKCFVLVLNKEDKIDEIGNLLRDNFNMHSSNTKYIIHYKGFV